MIVIRRHLDGDLPAEERKAREERLVIRHPVQRGIGENEIESVLAELLDRLVSKLQARR